MPPVYVMSNPAGSTPASDNLPSTITIVVKSLPERLTPEMRAKFPPSLVSTLETVRVRWSACKKLSDSGRHALH